MKAAGPQRNGWDPVKGENLYQTELSSQVPLPRGRELKEQASFLPKLPIGLSFWYAQLPFEAEGLSSTPIQKQKPQNSSLEARKQT